VAAGTICAVKRVIPPSAIRSVSPSRYDTTSRGEATSVRVTFAGASFPGFFSSRKKKQGVYALDEECSMTPMGSTTGSALRLASQDRGTSDTGSFRNAPPATWRGYFRRGSLSGTSDFEGMHSALGGVLRGAPAMDASSDKSLHASSSAPSSPTIRTLRLPPADPISSHAAHRDVESQQYPGTAGSLSNGRSVLAAQQLQQRTPDSHNMAAADEASSAAGIYPSLAAQRPPHSHVNVQDLVPRTADALYEPTLAAVLEEPSAREDASSDWVQQPHGGIQEERPASTGTYAQFADICSRPLEVVPVAYAPRASPKIAGSPRPKLRRSPDAHDALPPRASPLASPDRSPAGAGSPQLQGSTDSARDDSECISSKVNSASMFDPRPHHDKDVRQGTCLPGAAATAEHSETSEQHDSVAYVASVDGLQVRVTIVVFKTCPFSPFCAPCVCVHVCPCACQKLCVYMRRVHKGKERA
jgi:hypothetical protein